MRSNHTAIKLRQVYKSKMLTTQMSDTYSPKDLSENHITSQQNVNYKKSSVLALAVILLACKSIHM